jgi:hypothetical protein
MTEELKSPRLSVVRPSVDEIINGMVEGRDLFTDEQLEDVFLELGQLWIESKIKYQRRRNELQPWFGCTKEAIDDEVKKWVERNRLPALPQPDDDDPVAALVAITKHEAVLWHNAIRDGYATFLRDGHVENHKIDSEDFEHWLSDKYGETHQREINGNPEPTFPPKQILKEAIWQIQGYAKRGAERKPKIRITEYQGELWIDLGRPDWLAVVINDDDWRFEERMQAPLVRGDGMLPLPIPERGGDIQDLRQFVNIRDDAFPLFCGNIQTMFYPFGNYLTTLLGGPPGSAKTTITRIMRLFVDPDEMDTRAIAGERNLYHGASLTHVMAFENVSELSLEMSNAICRLNTGTAYGERKYWTQGREFRLKLHSPVIINGIPPNIAEQPDLLDRIISFRCDYLGDKVRSEETLKRKFNDMYPKLLGCFTLV